MRSHQLHLGAASQSSSEGQQILDNRDPATVVTTPLSQLITHIQDAVGKVLRRIN